MLKVQSRLHGNFDKALRQLEADVGRHVCLSGSAAMARVLYREAIQYASAHSKTGLLESAMRRRYNELMSNDKRKVYWVTWNPKVAPHGHFLEYGTSRAPAYPFIAPAFGHINEAIEAGKKQMAKKLKEITDGGPKNDG
jgi:HK97 gp10 family phage protein